MSDYDSYANMPTVDLNAQGLRCPMPLLKVKQALRGMGIGQMLCVTTTDPVSKRDLFAFTQQAGHDMLESREIEGVFAFTIRKMK